VETDIYKIRVIHEVSVLIKMADHDWKHSSITDLYQ